MKIVKTAAKHFRLYNEDGTPIGIFKTLYEAKRRMLERQVFKKQGKTKREANK